MSESMSNEMFKEYRKLKEQREKQIKRQNKYNKETYDTISFTVVKGQKKIIQEQIKEWGYSSMTEYINHLINNDFEMIRDSEKEWSHNDTPQPSNPPHTAPKEPQAENPAPAEEKSEEKPNTEPEEPEKKETEPPNEENIWDELPAEWEDLPFPPTP